ncbi:hypothetical protein HOD19_00070 [bacterium]|jgi:hypothetical protein|nr:hypothetical protein [bacterium]MBT4649237.1 hypothetical protein [bacterium]
MFVKVRELKTFFVSTNLQGIQRRQDQAEGGAIAQEDSNDINAMLLSGEWILLDTKHIVGTSTVTMAYVLGRLPED